MARASSTDPEAHVMRNGEGGTVPSYNVQLMTDTTHGLIVNVEATTDAVDHRQLGPALDRCEQALGRHPGQVVADGDYTNHASVAAAANCGVDFYGSWQESWKAGEGDAHGRSGAFLASAFPYDPGRDCFTCPAGETLTHRATLNREHGIRIHVYRAPKEACLKLSLTPPVRSAERASRLGAVDCTQPRNPRRLWPSRPRWQWKKPSRFTLNVPALPSFPTPGLKNAAACASSAVVAA